MIVLRGLSMTRAPKYLAGLHRQDPVRYVDEIIDGVMLASQSVGPIEAVEAAEIRRAGEVLLLTVLHSTESQHPGSNSSILHAMTGTEDSAVPHALW